MPVDDRHATASPADRQPHRRRHGRRPHREGHRRSRPPNLPSRRTTRDQVRRARSLPATRPRTTRHRPHPVNVGRSRYPTREISSDPDTEVIPAVSDADRGARPGRAAARTAERVAPHAGSASRVRRCRSTRRRTQAPSPDRCSPVVRGRALRGAGAGDDRRGVAVAVREEQHAQPGLGAGPELARHPRPQRTVRRRELPDRRRRQPLRRERRHGRRRHRGRRRRAVRHRDAGQHPGQPRTRCGGVVSA